VSGDARQTGCVVMAGGGGGGHLCPGLAVAEELRRRIDGLRVVFFGTGRPIEQRLIPMHGFELRIVPAAKAPGSIREVPTFPLRYWRSVRLAKKGLRELRPLLVAGLGGYGSVPAVRAAHRLGVPSVLLEQNSLPGKANRWLSKIAREVYTQWPESRGCFAHPGRVFVLGNPLRPGITAGDRDEALKRFGLDPGRRTLLVLGGSQGARTINRAVCDALDALASIRGLQVLHQTGTDDLDAVNDAYASAKLPHHVAAFIDDMAGAYAAATLIVGRAGATSLAEIAAVGRASVLVPYPHAANNHQHLNARSFEEAGAAVLLRDADLDGPRLATIVRELWDDEARLNAMAGAARGRAKPDATRDVCDRIMNIIRGS
jgi:UDP-N-acetylglucosamine--N-acetylmuramyl-(pentapeptide) pyrophosphoryl-undecaprenol N-acetylglucosamine transferase